jgi:hypothetical protein
MVAEAMRAVAAAALTAMVLAGGAGGSQPRCSRPIARAEVARAHLHLALGDGSTPVKPGQVDAVVCFDLTRDGRMDLALTVFSGGTAGDVGWAVFVGTATGYRLSLVRTGYKLGLFRVGADLVESQPVYRNGDPNCCPTGGFDHRRWRWSPSRQRFRVVRSWHDRSFRP